MTIAAPDLDGFADAMGRLREQLGADVTFHIPEQAQWDPAEPLDPETGRPYDPFATPVAGTGGERDEVVRAVVRNAVPTPTGDQVTASPIGAMPNDAIALDLDVADQPRIQGATHVTVYDRRFRVEELRPDGFNAPLRYLAFCRKA